MTGDIISGLRVSHSISKIISADGVSNGDSVDTANFERGTAFALDVTTRTDGSYLLSLEDSADDITFGAVDAANLIGSVTAVTANSSGALQKLGCFGTLRYVRPVVTASAVTTGAVRVTVVAIQGADLEPTT